VAAVALASAMMYGGGSVAQATDYFVDPNGAGRPNTYTSITTAIAAVTGQTDGNRANIYVAPGVYNEQISLAKPYVSLIGQSSAASDVLISFNGVPNVPPTSFGATFTATSAATGFMATNVTFENSQPDLNRTQALAVRSSADRTIFNNVRFLGYQDTVLIDAKSRAYVRNSFITGDTDFIYGNATAVFDRSTIESTDGGYITAASTTKDTANGFVFLDCTLLAGSDRNPAPNGLDDGTSARDNTVNLGRPWQWDSGTVKSSVIYIRTKMGTQIKAAGWDPWDRTGNTTSNPDPDGVTRYSEFGSMDLNGKLLVLDSATGMPVGRVNWADLMTAAQADNYTLANIFGGMDTVDFWNQLGTQPEGTGVLYVDTRSAWDPLAQLALLPAVPEPGSLAAAGVTSLLMLRRPRRRSGKGIGSRS
jgi:pectinesterase